MIATLTRQEEEHILLSGIRWDTYERLLHDLDGRHLRVTYDQGDLEVTTRSLRHESYNRLLGRLLVFLAVELNIPIRSGGSTTLKRKKRFKGLEPDDCFWIQNESRMRGKKEFDIKKDPPPDLAIEVDITHSSLNRMAIYAALGVPEVWRFDGTHLTVYRLGAEEKYRPRKHSPTFPSVPLDQIVSFVHKSAEIYETSLYRSFMEWVRAETLPVHEAGKSQQSRRVNGAK